MAGGELIAVAGDSTKIPLQVVHDVCRISGAGFAGFFKKDCTDLARRVSLLAYLLEEIRDSNTHLGSSSSSHDSCLYDLSIALKAAKRLLLAANDFDPKISAVSI